MILFFSLFSFADEGAVVAPAASVPNAASAPAAAATATANSAGDFTQADIAQIGSLVGNLSGSKAAGQVGNGLALVQAISDLKSSLAKAPLVPTNITASSKNFIADLNLIVSSATAAATEAKSIGAGSTSTQLDAIATKAKAYIATKESCVSGAETAENLCVEGNSKGAIMVKALMTMATPALGIISSAQKACSTTAKLTDFASKGLTVAKGACVAAKATCDSTCGSAQTQLTALSAQLNSLDGIATAELKALATSAGLSGNEAYLEEVKKFMLELPKFKFSTTQTLAKETVPATESSTTWLVAKCTSHTKDLILLGLNIASLVAAKGSANDCAEKLSSSNASTTTTAQYCEMAANVSTQYCICQKNSNQQGCPGYVASTGATATTLDQAGVDVKSTGTGNQFASANIAAKPTSALGTLTGSTGAGSTTGSTSDPTSSTTSGSAGLGAGSSFGGSGGGAGSAPGADIGSNSGTAKDAAEKKKWSFGSFMGMGGDGGGSGSGSHASSNSKLGEKDMAAIKRQIASEQLRAEVSEASGKSNWEKVRERYQRNSTSLLDGK